MQEWVQTSSSSVVWRGAFSGQIRREHGGIAHHAAGLARADPGLEQMRGKQERNQHAGRKLPDGGARQPPGLQPRDSPQRQRKVGDERRAEQDRARQRARHRDAPVLEDVHGVQADEAERVIEEVEQREAEQGEPGGEADGVDPGAGARKPRHGSGFSLFAGYTTQVRAPGQQPAHASGPAAASRKVVRGG